MNLSSPGNSIRDEWRALGFYCTPPDDTGNRWYFVGSRQGLGRLASILREYIVEPVHAKLSEHDHLTPYGWLEIMTWSEAIVTDHAISGSLKDLSRLADLIESSLRRADSGEVITIRSEYSASSTCEIVLDVRDDAYDPGSADPHAV